MTVLPIPVGELETNCYLIYDRPQEAVIVDPGAEADRILHTIAEHGATVKAILLTHAHFDHILAAEEVAKACAAPLYIHELEKPALTDGMLNLSSLMGQGTCHLQADHFLKDGDEVAVGELVFRVVHTPGHTVGSCCYELVGRNILIAGDTLFRRSYGRTDLPGGNYRQLKESLHRLFQMEGDAVVYPGHGPATTLAEERGQNPILGF